MEGIGFDDEMNAIPFSNEMNAITTSNETCNHSLTAAPTALNVQIDHGFYTMHANSLCYYERESRTRSK